MKRIFLFAAAAAILAAAPVKRTITGVITDTMCGADHKAMGISPDSKCVRECVKMDPTKWKYAVLVGNKMYVLSDQLAGDKYAAQKVTVTGMVDDAAKTVQVQSIAPAK